MEVTSKDSITLTFAQNVLQDEFKVFEMKDELVEELLASSDRSIISVFFITFTFDFYSLFSFYTCGFSFQIRGAQDSEAVLVSSNKT